MLSIDPAVIKVIVFIFIIIIIIFQGLKHMLQASLYRIAKFFNAIVAIVLGICDFPCIGIENWYMAMPWKDTKLLPIGLVLFLFHLLTFFRRIGISSPTIRSLNLFSLHLLFLKHVDD